MKLLVLCCILVSMATATVQTGEKSWVSFEQLLREPHVARALEWLVKSVAWIDDEQIRITEIPAPTFHEGARATELRRLFSSFGLRVRDDEVGNVIGERAGASENELVMLSAHLDTVFPRDTPVKVRREGGRWLAPGISDNGTGLAAMAAVARALEEGEVKTRATLLFAANVGEEGEGNLRGMRKLVQTYGSRLKYVIVLDGSSIEHVTTSALASRRIEASIVGPGGHSWSDFGLPNPIHALSRGVSRFVQMRVPENPRTTFNVGVIEGGTSVNSIPHHAAIKVDLRSEADSELDALERRLREALQNGVEEEMSAGRNRGMALGGSHGGLELTFHVLGVRPAGNLPESSLLLRALREADRYIGNCSRAERSSTDANIPLSLGIHAISLGAGGHAGGAHSLSEWYEPAGREKGLARVLLTVLGVAGVETSKEQPRR